MEVVDGYLNARNGLMRSYEDNLDGIRSWLENRASSAFGLRAGRGEGTA